MKRKVITLLLLLAAILPLSAQQTVSSSTSIPTAPYLCNNPLPYRPAKLDVLFIGNSFSIDTAARLPEILSSMFISNVNVYVLYKGGCSLREHYDNLKSDKRVYELYRYNVQGETKLEKSTTIRNTLSRYPYDIVVFQQYSADSGLSDTYEPWLAKLIQAYRLCTISPRTTFAFNQTWAWSSTHKNISRYGSPQKMYSSICESVRRMRATSGIDIVIPVGTAIQNARSSKHLDLTKEFTRDTQHLDLNQGRYVAACTFFEAIIAPCLSRSIRDDISIIGKTGESNQVNNANRRILQNCARLAVANNYSVSEFVDE